MNALKYNIAKLAVLTAYKPQMPKQYGNKNETAIYLNKIL
jgi:hypothetical protein